ncbi:MAG: metallophosphoesterase [Acidobacteria bacterium]|nr:metallophosphoesterase [Acidobacteriota bacterium]
MKILVFSDIHGDYRALERLMAMEADRYVAAGDLSTWGRGLDRLGEILARRAGSTWVLPGNHESEGDIERLCGRFGLENLHGRSKEVGGVMLAGLGYSSPTPFDTPGEYTEAQLEAKLEPFAALEPLVLVCHCPPRNTLLDRVRPGVHAGSEAVGRFIGRVQPAYFFCGHGVHGGRQRRKEGVPAGYRDHPGPLIHPLALGRRQA